MIKNKRVVLITGAASGIGAAVTRRIASSECNLVLHTRGKIDKRINELHKVANEAVNKGSKVKLIFGDFSEDNVAINVIKETIDHYGKIDQIVSNAGFADKRVFGDLQSEDLENSQKSMAGAFFDLITAAIPSLKNSICGRIVAVSSFVSHKYVEDGLYPTTAAAKASLESLAKSLAIQLAHTGTTVNCVAPGYTHKDISAHSALTNKGWKNAAKKIPMGYLGKPDDHAAMIAFLLSNDAKYITGQVIHIDGGLTLT